MSERSVKNFALLVDGCLYTTLNKGREVFADRMVTDSKVLPCGTSRIAQSNGISCNYPSASPGFICLADMVEREGVILFKVLIRSFAPVQSSTKLFATKLPQTITDWSPIAENRLKAAKMLLLTIPSANT